MNTQQLFHNYCNSYHEWHIRGSGWCEGYGVGGGGYGVGGGGGWPARGWLYLLQGQRQQYCVLTK